MLLCLRPSLSSPLGIRCPEQVCAPDFPPARRIFFFRVLGDIVMVAGAKRQGDGGRGGLGHLCTAPLEVSPDPRVMWWCVCEVVAGEGHEFSATRRNERGRAGSRRVVRAYRCRVEGIEEQDDRCR